MPHFKMSYLGLHGLKYLHFQCMSLYKFCLEKIQSFSHDQYKYILTDFNYATLTSPYIFQKTVECKLPLLR